MKHYYVISIIAIMIALGCTKSISTNTPSTLLPPIKQITIKVVEKSTNRPIEGANVYLQKCSKYDPVFGCVMFSTFSILTTNAEGKVSYSNFAEKIKVEANNYWTSYNKPYSEIILTPKTIIEVSVKREKTYSPTDNLWIGEGMNISNYGQYLSSEEYKPIGLPVDTIVYVKGYGYTENKISWNINYLIPPAPPNTSIGGSSPIFYINGFDTARVQIKY